MLTTYKIDGMHCDHCVMHVKEEVSKIPGVTVNALSLDDGLLIIDSATPVDFDQLQAAVAEAGDYQAGVA